MIETSRTQRWVQFGANALIVGVALTVLSPFLIAVGWAAILAVATWPVFERLSRGLRNWTGVAAGAMVLLVVLVVLIPAGLLSLALATEIQRTFADFQSWAPALPSRIVAALSAVPWVGARLAEHAREVLGDPAAVERWLLANAARWPAAIASAAGNVGRNALDAVLALLTLFFFYVHGAALGPRVQRAILRAGGERMATTVRPLADTVRAVMYGTLFTALSQGVLAMAGYWLVGLRAPVLLGALSALLALTPVGAALVYVPAAVWLLVQGKVAAGLVLLGWGMLVVSLADNVIRSWFLSSALELPFLLGLFGVLGGVLTFGALGLFVGPIAVGMLLALWREWTAEP